MKNDYKVKDISLAEFGRQEILLAQDEMPALMQLRERYRVIIVVVYFLSPNC